MPGGFKETDARNRSETVSVSVRSHSKHSRLHVEYMESFGDRSTKRCKFYFSFSLFLLTKNGRVKNYEYSTKLKITPVFVSLFIINLIIQLLVIVTYKCVCITITSRGRHLPLTSEVFYVTTFLYVVLVSTFEW